ncbi:MAG: FAD-dependent oxidoreductase [Halolamina sp.]
MALEFVERATANGVRFETNTEVTDIDTADETVTRLETDGSGRVDPDYVVCAPGPWNHSVAALAGLDLPLEQMYSPVFALQLDEPLSYTLPMLKSHDSALRWAERLLPVLAEAELRDEWVGLGTDTPDGEPIVGRTSIDGLFRGSRATATGGTPRGWTDGLSAGRGFGSRRGQWTTGTPVEAVVDGCSSLCGS